MNHNFLEKYSQLLLHNNTAVYIIHNGKNWYTVKETVTSDILKKHLERKITICLQPARDDETIKWMKIDFDAHKNEPIQEIQENVLETKKNLSKANIQSYLEQSGRGYHLWIFLPNLY